jgi:RNA polymerase sigma-70 factor (sigma-E family)
VGAVDDASFREFFCVQYERLRRLGYLLSGDWAQAEDLAQEALTQTFWRWRLFGRGGHPAAYARKVLVNKYRSLMRRAVLERRYLTSERHEEQAVRTGDREEALVIQAAIRGLPPKQRLVVVLRYHEDLSEAEVARLLRLRVGTVKSTAHRALAKLRGRLGDPDTTMEEGMRR